MSCMTVKIERVPQPMEVSVGLVCSVPAFADFNEDFNDDFLI